MISKTEKEDKTFEELTRVLFQLVLHLTSFSPICRFYGKQIPCRENTVSYPETLQTLQLFCPSVTQVWLISSEGTWEAKERRGREECHGAECGDGLGRNW